MHRLYKAIPLLSWTKSIPSMSRPSVRDVVGGLPHAPPPKVPYTTLCLLLPLKIRLTILPIV